MCIGLYIDVTQIESFSVGEDAKKTIISMRSGKSWEVHGRIADIIDECFQALSRISRETNNAN